MALKRVQKSRRIFDELPVAKLHLDDVREIVNIMSIKDSDSITRDPVVSYRVRDFECDTLEELETIGGSARNFEIIVLNQGRRSTLRMRGGFTFLNLSAPASDCSFRREKIREIFDANLIWWKQLPRDIAFRVPYWFGIGLIALSLLWAHFDPTHDYGGFLWASVFSAVLFYFLVLRGSVVILRYAHSSSPQKWIREHATQIAFIILSAVLGAVGKEMIAPLKNWITHFGH
ncbi:MAG TPA: hypothetical protein VHV29_02165 [Terriglobales bacterium]|jgi:hypothetical protein|nr:hypothetical protein [Terriglobales bacterium]